MGIEQKKIPLVTAVITTYKREIVILKRALESVVNQDYPCIEIIIVNDYPQDLSLATEIGDLLDNYRAKREINYIIQEQNGGACKARNKAIELANGKYIAFLDDDDEWLSEKISLMVQDAERSENIGLVYSNFITVIDDKNSSRISRSSNMPEGNIYKSLIKSNIIGSCSFPMFSTDALKETGGFNEKLPALQDWELYLRYTKENEVTYIDKPLTVYHFHSGERISSHPENRTFAYEVIKKQLGDDLKGCKKEAAAFYLMGTYFYSLNNDIKTANQYLIKSIKLYPSNIKNYGIAFIKMLVRVFIKQRISK